MIEVFPTLSRNYLLLSGKPLHKTTKTSGSCSSAAVISMAAKRILQFGQLPHNIQLVQLSQILTLLHLSMDSRVAVTPLLIVGDSLSPALVTQPRSACKLGC